MGEGIQYWEVTFVLKCAARSGIPGILVCVLIVDEGSNTGKFDLLSNVQRRCVAVCIAVCVAARSCQHRHTLR